jgi:hypothetical protein
MYKNRAISVVSLYILRVAFLASYWLNLGFPAIGPCDPAVGAGAARISWRSKHWKNQVKKKGRVVNLRKTSQHRTMQIRTNSMKKLQIVATTTLILNPNAPMQSFINLPLFVATTPL